LEISETELERITPLLLGSWAGALGWWRVRNSSLKATRAAELMQAYRLHALHTHLYERHIKQSFELLRLANIEPILIKGWASARLYPEPGLRPYVDIDLCVAPAQYFEAKAVLQSEESKGCWVDLHQGLSRFDDRSWDELYACSQLVELDDTKVRVLGAEDHLRVMCVHLLGHGAWRPIWLCDIAAALESAPKNFDWDYFLGDDKRRATWLACTIGLAHQLLGAEVRDTPLAEQARHLPNWLVPSVLKQWEMPYATQHEAPKVMISYFRQPTGLLRAIRRRWPNPITATFRMGASFNQLPRMPFQMADYFIQSAKFLLRLPGLIREQH
jgi:hypothetical protein